MNRNEALELLHEHMKNANLRKHCYAVEAAMRALAEKFNADQDKWGIAGLLHDADYEEVKDNEPKLLHTLKTLEWLKDYEVDQEIIDAIKAHAWNYVDGAPEPKNKMEWSLYCCDELTGFIVAVALIRPEKLLEPVTPENIKSKWSQKAFAAGVHRGQIELCEEKLNIPLDEFIEIVLNSMKEIHNDLGL